MTQRTTGGIVTHGTMVYRTTPEECTPDVPGATPTTYEGCQNQGGTVSQTNNYMTLYELDSDGDDFVETLYFPDTTVTLTGCTYDGCPEQTSSWVDLEDSTYSWVIIDAQLRMKARAYLEGPCGWTPPLTNPVIDSFAADSTTIAAGESATLTWTTTNATSVSIAGISGTLAVDGSTTVSPTTTTTYTLTASGASGTTAATATVTITVNPAEPVIDTFTADATTIAADGSTTLRWTTTNATTVSISGVTEALAVDGSVSVTPSATTTYTLTARGGSGTSAASASVTISISGWPTATLTAEPTAITAGGSTTLRWTTTNASSVSIDQGVGTVTPLAGGSVSVSPTTTTTYTLTAEGASGTTAASATVTITVNPPQHTIDSFTADDTTPAIGASVTFTWRTSNADSAYLQKKFGSVWGYFGTAAVNGSRSFSRASAGSESYRLAARKDFHDVYSEPITVTWAEAPPADPVIDTFTADAMTITAGGSTTLRWTTTNASAVSISGVSGTLAVDGSVSVTPSATTTYTLTARGGSGTSAASASVTISISGWPTATLTAEPTAITAGGSATLRWASSNASSVSIDQGVGSVTPLAGGSVSVSPSATTTYTLTASDDDAPSGDATASVTITVNPADPVIDTFTADAMTITAGGSATLSWTTTNATTVSISGVSGTLAVDGSQSVSPSATTSYTLTARGGSGTTAATATVRVTVGPPDSDPDPDPPSCGIDAFSADPATITLGGSTTLRWTTTGFTAVSIPGTSGTLAVDGSTSVSPTADTPYTLTARGGSCTTDSATTTVRVRPRIDSFTASETTITLGGSSTLRWTTTGATAVSLSNVSGTLAVDDSTSVSPTSRPTTTYTLTASNSAGSTTASVTINVNLAPCLIDSFSASEATITRGGAATLSWTTSRATAVSIPGTTGTLDVDDSTSVSPTSTTTYTLTARGSDCDTASDTATVTVVPPPLIDTFTASATTITEGGSSTLRWTTTGATTVTVSGLSGALALDGSRRVSPTATSSYTLTAKNSADTPASDSATVTVTVTPRPPTASLSVDPEEIFNAGDGATLTWSTANASSASIDQGVGEVTPVADGSTTVYPAGTTTYTLTASGPGGSASDTATVYTVDTQQSLTATLTAEPAAITSGGSATLRWTSEGADRAEIDQGVGSVTPLAGGSVSVTPSATTTYTLTATSGEGEDAVSASASVEVSVTQPAPVIDSFGVDDATPQTGETVTLSWTTSHAGSADLRRKTGSSWESVGAVELNGSHSVTRARAGSESYQLAISRDNRAVLSAPLTISWSDPPAE